MVDEKRIKFLMKQLGISRQEAIELEGYDDAVDHNRKTEHDLTPEQEAVVKELNRKKEHKKYGHVNRERKPNETKEGIVAVLADFLENECEFELKGDTIYCDDVQITNKNRMIHFVCNGKKYDLQLIEKRLPKN